MTKAAWGDATGENRLGSLISMGIACFMVSCSAADSFTLYKSTQGGIPLANVGDCPTSPYEGPHSSDPTGLTFQVEDTGYFKKAMVSDHIQALLQSSGWSTWLYARSLGVKVSKVTESSQSNCRYFAFLQEPPSEVQQSWSDFSQSSRGKLLGLYTTTIERTEEGLSSLRNQQITLREDAHRWTLLHEIAHSLFATEKVKVPFFYFGHELEKQLREISRKANRVQSAIENGDGTEQEALELISLWKGFFATSHKLHIRGPLEEFSIESLLLKEYINNKLSLIDERIEPINAVAYMESNSQAVLVRYNRLIKKVSEFSQVHFKEEWTQAQNETQSLIQKVEDPIGFIHKKMKIARDFKAQRELPHQNNPLPQILWNEQHQIQLPQVIDHYDQRLHENHGKLYEETF